MKKTKNKVSIMTHFWVSSLIFCLILIPTFLQAKEMTETEVRSAVQTWVRNVTAHARPDAVIERMEPHQVQGKTVAYIAHLMNGGFCLCGADDLVLPVYFYSPQGTYDPSIPDYQDILWEIAERVKYLQKGLEEKDPSLQPYHQALSERASFWQDLIAGRILPRIEKKGVKGEPVMMELDLTCTWRQGSPYNDLCPQLTPAADEHTKVGCVAIAMSQIMYYWKWPNTGVGNGSTVYNYRWRNNLDEEPLAADPIIPAGWAGRLGWTAANGGRLRMNGYWDGSLYKDAQDIDSAAAYLNALEALYNRLNNASTNCNANFGTTTYQWSLIQDIHDDVVHDAGDTAVATLCYHAGIAVGMNYGVSESGAPSAEVENALRDHFRYDTDADYQGRDINKMTTEILWLRPLQLRGTRHDTLGGGGHAWVVFGYDKGTDPNRQFLMNMGWGGGSDGWYSCDSVPGGYTISQDHTIQIAPQNVVKFVGAASLGDGSPDDPYRDIEEAVAEAPNGATLIFKAGSDNTFSAVTLTITKPLTLKGVDVVIRKE
jgi:hypothetical protein